MRFSRSAVLVAAILSLGQGLGDRFVCGQDGGVDAARFREHLQAGEFGVAQRMARNASDGALRDRLLGEVAVAQARAGARRAAMGSLADLANDSARAAAANRVRSALPYSGNATVPTAANSARGGAAAADFDSLIELITTTIAPDSWDTVGGPGAVQEFPAGVYVDAGGTMKRIASVADGLALERLRRESAAQDRVRASEGAHDVRASSVLRKVSLTRLEKALQARWAVGLPPDETMQALAGLRRVQFVFVYPETGEVVVAGPAGDWREDHERRIVGADDGRPVLLLDDLLVLLRQSQANDPSFGCSIEPRKENLAQTKAFLDSWNGKKLRPGQRDEWLNDLRETMGQQDIVVFGIDARTHAAHVIVEADYRMKLVGMGLEDGTVGVQSYLDALIASGKPATDMTMLRWWFTLNPNAIQTTEGRDAFMLDGASVRVLSENEFLNERGERVHTGKSDDLSSRFAQSFTKHFDKLAEKYPVYAELRNVFDLSLVASLIREQDLTGQVGWEMTHFVDAERSPAALRVPPRQVNTVMNYRNVDANRFVAGVSGGVTVNARTLTTASALKTDSYGALVSQRKGATPAKQPRDRWWWD